MTATRDDSFDHALGEEFEHEAVPVARRQRLGSVAAIWFGFPMILTNAVFGGIITYNLGFWTALGALACGNAVLAGYVGALSSIAGRTGLNFAMQARRTFGTKGFAAASGFLATVVIGWYAFQTGLTGATLHDSFGWNTTMLIVIAAVLYTAVTFIGIRALTVIGLIAAPLYVVLGLVAVAIVARTHDLGDVTHFAGHPGGMGFAGAVTLVIATFADSGTMTADFTRWSRSGKEAVLAALTAFPVANLVSQLFGVVVVAAGAATAPAKDGGNFLSLLTGHGLLLSALAVAFGVRQSGIGVHALPVQRRRRLEPPRGQPDAPADARPGRDRRHPRRCRHLELLPRLAEPARHLRPADRRGDHHRPAPAGRDRQGGGRRGLPHPGLRRLGCRRRCGDAGPSGHSGAGRGDHGHARRRRRLCGRRPRSGAGRHLPREAGERMNGLGGLNKSPNGVVIGLVQLKLEQIDTPDDLARQTRRIVDLVAKARRNMATMDLVVFPEYALHGLSMSTDPSIMCRMDGPEVAAFRKACIENEIWGCFSIMEANPAGNPYNVGLVIDAAGEIKLYYRKLHPWVPVEPWEPGDLGIPVIEGPNGCKLALIICHDGMFPEMARECAYKGAEIMLRTAGYTAPIRHSWRFTNQANAFQNLMVTANVCMCGSDGTFDSMGEGMVCDFDGAIIAHGTTGRADEIITAEVRPDLVREARAGWGVENNIYQLGHRGFTAVKGGANDCPYTFMHDLVAGRYRLPWEVEVKVTDGTGCGFEEPTRTYAPRRTDKMQEAAE